MQFDFFFNKTKEKFKRSLFSFLFSFSDLGQLLSSEETPEPFDFFNTYYNSWPWSRLWFRSYLQDAIEFKNMEILVEILKAENRWNKEYISSFAKIINLGDWISKFYPYNRNNHKKNGIFKAYESLSELGWLTKENFTLFIQHYSNDNHPASHGHDEHYSQSLIQALSKWQRHRQAYVTETEFKAILKHQQPYSSSIVLDFLNESQCLNSHTINIWSAYQYHNASSNNVLKYLKTFNILTEENFEQLLSLHRPILFTDEADEECWDKFDEAHPLTVTVFKQLIQAADQPEPSEQTLKEIFLAYKNGETAAVISPKLQAADDHEAITPRAHCSLGL